MGLSSLQTSPVPPLSHPIDHMSRVGDLSEYYHNHRATASVSDLEYMAMADGRVDVGGVYHFELEPATVDLYVGGSLVRARPERPAGGSQGEAPSRSQGDITGFSSHSRRRLMRLIAQTKRDERPLFVTLTYPDEFDTDISRWKRDLDVFGKRVLRHFPDAGLVWRIEFKERLTGRFAGVIAPHYHLLVWNVPILDFREFGDKAWFEVVGSGDDRHLRAGVSSERVRKWGGTMAYVSKYIAKVDEFPLDWSGRVWGVIGRQNIPWADLVTIELIADHGVKLVRLARKMMGIKGKSLPFGVTFLCNADRILDYLEWLNGFT